MAKELKEGAKAPSFSILNDKGEKVSLKDYAGKNLVLYFYPKDDTPGCTKEACDFTSSLSQFNKLNAIVLGVSKDSVESHVKFKNKYKIKFPLLSDVDGKLCEKYGVWQEKMNYGKKYMGIVRSTFVIDAEGKIAKIFPKVKVDGHVDAISEVLRSL